MVGLGRLELPTSRLSGVRSNQLSYRPQNDNPNKKGDTTARPIKKINYLGVSKLGMRNDASLKLVSQKDQFVCIIKEVIQPQVLLQLPCYDFTPIIDHTVVAYSPKG